MKLRIIGGSGKTYLARRLAQEYDAGMLAHRHDPFLHRADLGCLAGALEGAVICHDAVLAVEFCALGKQVNIIFFSDTDTPSRRRSCKPGW